MDVSWTIKKAECQRIDALELRCWRRLLRVPWTARRSNQSILKEINPEYSLEGLLLKLKLQYFGHMVQRADSLEKTLMLGKIEGRRRREQQRVRWLNNITDSMEMCLNKLQEIVKDRKPWRAADQRVRHELAIKQEQPMRYGLVEGPLSQLCGGWILGDCGQKKKLPAISVNNKR